LPAPDECFTQGKEQSRHWRGTPGARPVSDKGSHAPNVGYAYRASTSRFRLTGVRSLAIAAISSTRTAVIGAGGWIDRIGPALRGGSRGGRSECRRQCDRTTQREGTVTAHADGGSRTLEIGRPYARKGSAHGRSRRSTAKCSPTHAKSVSAATLAAETAAGRFGGRSSSGTLTLFDALTVCPPGRKKIRTFR
jgi:hypothetical protein